MCGVFAVAGVAVVADLDVDYDGEYDDYYDSGCVEFAAVAV